MIGPGAGYRGGSSGPPAVVVGPAASDLERYAATGLCRHLSNYAPAEILPPPRLFRLTQAAYCY